MNTSGAGSKSKIEEICSSLASAGYTVKFRGYSALDLYFRLPPLPFFWIETNADIAALARYIDNLRFPGVDIADAAVEISGASPDEAEGQSFKSTCYFRCLESEELSAVPFLPFSLTYDWQTKRFQDPLEVYPLLRKFRDSKIETVPDLNAVYSRIGNSRVVIDATLLLARYGFSAEALAKEQYPPHGMEGIGHKGPGFPPEAQRLFLSCLLLSSRPEVGLELLKMSGFLKEFWPELASLNDVDHSKEFHPEGNVWKHTLETFRYRKPAASGAFDLRLSLALLLHDTGKPISASFGNHRFEAHAELGAQAAARFLERLEFEPPLIRDIYYLVRNHMLPAALKRLPLSKTAEIMASPLFPTLMELYRCDESSSFKGLDGYYENSAAYQTYLKNIKNPYRAKDGRKIKRNNMYLGNS
jgi:poly(A) polymerase